MDNLKKWAVLALACGFLFPLAAFGAVAAAEYYKWGLKFYQEKKYDQAEKYFRYALQVDPQDWRSYQALGVIETAKGEDQQALQALQRSLEINPGNDSLKRYVKNLRARMGPSAETAPVKSAPEKAAGDSVPAPAATSPILETPPGISNPAYVWDPALDPYPLYTGPASPLPKPEIPVTPKIYLTASYGTGVIFITTVNTSTGTFNYSPAILSLGLRYQLDPMVSMVLGTEIWPANSYVYNHNSYGYGGFSYTSQSTENFTITPVSLGFFIHHWSSGLSIDAGASLTAFFYQHQISSDTLDTNVGSTSEYINQNILSGEEFGGIIQSDLTLALLPQNQLDLVLTGKVYLDSGVGFYSGTSLGTYIYTNPPNPPIKTTSNYPTNYFGSSGGLGILGGTIGLGLQGGF